MPHFVIHTSAGTLQKIDEESLLKEVFDVAEESALFDVMDIKVRVETFKNFIVRKGKEDFLHVFAYIMQGRTEEQKASLSRAMVSKLKSILTEVPIISMNVMDFEQATYCNREMVN